MCLNFCLSFPEISIVLPGMMKRSEVLENSLVNQVAPLNRAEIKKIINFNLNKYSFLKKC